MVGVEWANDVVQAWRRHGRWFQVKQEDEVFRFGDGNTLRSKYRLQLEATFGGRRVLMAFSVVGGPCPPLLSKQSHTLLGVNIDTEHHTMSSKKLKVKNYGLSETKAGHYTVKIDEFHLLESRDKAEGFQMEAHEEVCLLPHDNDKMIPEAFGSQHERPADPQVRVDVLDEPTDMSTVRRSGSPSDSVPRSGFRGRGELSEGVRGRGVFSPPRTIRVGSRETGRASRECEEGGACGNGCGAAEEPRQRSRSPRECCVGQHAIEEYSQEDRSQETKPGSSGIRGGRAAEADRGLTSHPRIDHGGAGSDSSTPRATRAEGSEAEGICSSDGMGGTISILGEQVERRLGMQRDGEHMQQVEDIPMEEAGVAVAGARGHQSGVPGQGSVEAQRAMAELPPEQRGGVTMGAVRGYEAEVEEPRFRPPAFWRRLGPSRGLIQKFKKGLSEAREAHLAVVDVKRMREHYLVLEIFAGCAQLTSVANAKEGWKALPPVDLVYGQDLRNPKTRKELMYLVKKTKPDPVTMSPRCGPWSQFQRINPNIDKVMEDRKEDIPLWRFCREVWDEQTAGGRLALTENPQQSAALTLGFMMSRPNLHRAIIPQCAFGLVDVISGKPHQEMTAFDVNDECMKDALLEGAVCRHSPEEHQQIEGNVYYEWKWQRRSALASRWPKALCEHILQAAERAWEKCDDDAPKKLTEGREPGRSHYILPVEVGESPEGELRRQLEKADWRGGQYDYVFFEGTSRQCPHKMRQALAHLHVVLGHPSEERLTRMLLISGCSQQVIDAARGLRRQICQAVRPPGAEPKVNLNRPTRFNERLLGDSFFIWDSKGERFNVTHLIDGLTEYHVGAVTKQVGAEATADLLQNKWCMAFGPPEILQTDGGKEFADVIYKVSKLLDFRHEVVPPGAKWRQGQVERHGAVVKLMMMRVATIQQAVGLEDMKLVASSCFNAKNRLCNRLGLSPLQAVTGRNTSVPVSVMEQLCSGHIKCTIND